MATPSFTMDWRNSASSDWQCSAGDRCYALHKNVVAEGSRSSQFFRAAFNELYEAVSTDLTALLPAPCHKYLDSVFDFMYGHDISLDKENVFQVWKIADALQIDSLLPLAKAAADEFVSNGETSHQTWVLARQLGLPADAVHWIFESMNPSEAILALAEHHEGPDHVELLRQVAEKMQHNVECTSYELEGLMASRTHGDRASVMPPCILLSFKYDPSGNLSVFPLKEVKARVSSCRVRIVQWSCCYAATIGISSEHANLSKFDENCHIEGSGGFAHLQHCWGLNYGEKKLFSQGESSLLSVTAQRALEVLVGNVLRIELNTHKGSLSFFCENAAGDVELGTIMAPFHEQGKLFFTASKCGSACEFELLDMAKRSARERFEGEGRIDHESQYSHMKINHTLFFNVEE